MRDIINFSLGVDSMLRDFSKEGHGERGESLIITAAIAPSPLYPEAKNAPSSVEATIETASACCGAGASIIHVDDSSAWTARDWSQVLGEIRRRCDVILEADFSRRPSEEKLALLELRPDLSSLPVGHHSLAFFDGEVDALHSLDEVKDSLVLCKRFRVKPALEIWHSGSIWRLNDLIVKGLVGTPYFLTLYLGWPGGNWSPPTVEELLYRFRLLPENCICSVSVAANEQTTLSGLTLGLGGHLRVGTRDNPYVKEGVLARDNIQLVEQVARLGTASGRKPATPAEARKMLGITAQ